VGATTTERRPVGEFIEQVIVDREVWELYDEYEKTDSEGEAEEEEEAEAVAVK